MAEIPIQPKRTPEIPVEPKRRRSMWPWMLGLLALLLIPFLFMRGGRDDAVVASDTSAVVDTTTRFDGRTIGTVGGTVAPGVGATLRADSAVKGDTTARADSASRPDTTGR